MSTSLSVGVIRAGPGGLALGIFLRKAGFRDFTIFDREGGVGGTWRINTCPGLACPNTNVGSNSVIFMMEAQARYIVRALSQMRRRRKPYIAVRQQAMAAFIAKIDEWMQGTVWLTRCHNYFRAANGRVVTQWPRSARAFWGMTRRFKASDYTFAPPAATPNVESHAAAHR